MLLKLDISFSGDDNRAIPLVKEEVPGFIAGMEKKLGKKVHSWKIRKRVIQITLNEKMAVEFFEVISDELKLRRKDVN